MTSEFEHPNDARHSHHLQRHALEGVWRKYIVICKAVENLRVRDKRHLFGLMRTCAGVTEDSFFPMYGFTAGEFTIFQVLTDKTRKMQSPPPIKW